MDNRSNEVEWDTDLLGGELQELKDLGADLTLSGFDSREIDELLAASADQDEAAESIPPIPDNPVSRPGDLWLLGDPCVCPHCGAEN